MNNYTNWTLSTSHSNDYSIILEIFENIYSGHFSDIMVKSQISLSATIQQNLEFPEHRVLCLQASRVNAVKPVEVLSGLSNKKVKNKSSKIIDKIPLLNCCEKMIMSK